MIPRVVDGSKIWMDLGTAGQILYIQREKYVVRESLRSTKEGESKNKKIPECITRIQRIVKCRILDNSHYTKKDICVKSRWVNTSWLCMGEEFQRNI